MQRPELNPWVPISPGGMQYLPDYTLLEAMLGVPVGEGVGSQSGRLAKATDAWVSQELRRAGFGTDEVWPRLTAPRILPREVDLFVKSLPATIRSTAEASLARNRAAAPSDARILGRAYVKTGRCSGCAVVAWDGIAGVDEDDGGLVEVRQRREHRDLPLDEGDTP
ncbi:MAG: hypothetical protein ACRDST_03860 [Pseudonocardiaceae bacterium]